MKIVQIAHSVPFYNQAGTEIYTQALSEELSKEHEVYILCRISDTKQKEYEVTEKRFGNLKCYLINNTFKHCNSFEKFYQNDIIDERFSQLLDKIKPDIVHIQHLVFLSLGIIERIKQKNVPMVLTLHDYWLFCPKWHLLKANLEPCDKAGASVFDNECLGCLRDIFSIKRPAAEFYRFSKGLLPPSIIKRLKNAYLFFAEGIFDNKGNIDRLKEMSVRVKTLLKNVDIFLAPSLYLKNKFIDFGIPSGKIKISEFGLDKKLFRNQQKERSPKLRFAFIGTILPAKGVHVLIEAFNGTKEGAAELKIYGKLNCYAGFEDYPAYVQKIAKNENISFMDAFSHEIVGDIFKDVDVLVVPSLWMENSPLVVYEAFLSKTPVVASRVGGIPELVNDGVNGLLFNPGDAKDLQGKLEYLINNPEAVDKFRQNAKDIKSIEEATKEIGAIYCGLVSN